QREAYGDAYQESATVLGGKLALARASCWGAEAGGVLLGYAFAHPWRRASPPPLHAALESLPAAADAMFVHDVAIAACARGHGLAARLLARIEAAARAGGYPALRLVAMRSPTGSATASCRWRGPRRCRPATVPARAFSSAQSRPSERWQASAEQLAAVATQVEHRGNLEVDIGRLTRAAAHQHGAHAEPARGAQIDRGILDHHAAA